jgi:hypothetical protein
MNILSLLQSIERNSNKQLERRSMMKKVIAAIFAVLYLASFGALAADTHKCAKNHHWNKADNKCVVNKK